MKPSEFAFVVVTTAVAILIIEPLFESILKSISPTVAAKVGVV